MENYIDLRLFEKVEDVPGKCCKAKEVGMIHNAIYFSRTCLSLIPFIVRAPERAGHLIQRSLIGQEGQMTKADAPTVLRSVTRL